MLHLAQRSAWLAIDATRCLRMCWWLTEDQQLQNGFSARTMALSQDLIPDSPSEPWAAASAQLPDTQLPCVPFVPTDQVEMQDQVSSCLVCGCVDEQNKLAPCSPPRKLAFKYHACGVLSALRLCDFSHRFVLSLTVACLVVQISKMVKVGVRLPTYVGNLYR